MCLKKHETFYNVNLTHKLTAIDEGKNMLKHIFSKSDIC